MGLQAEHDGLRDGEDGREGPAQTQEQPSAVGGGAVGDGEDDGAEPGGRSEGHYLAASLCCPALLPVN